MTAKRIHELAAAVLIVALAHAGGRMPPRNLRESLDARHHRQASVITGTYLHPVGPAHAKVRLDGSAAEITVPVAVGPKTWAPGARVSLARPDGSSPRHEIIGGPTSGQLGGSLLAPRREPPGPPPADPYYAYVLPGGVVEAWRYADGDPVELLGVLDASTPGATVGVRFASENPQVGDATLIVGDPTGRVADGSIAFSGPNLSDDPRVSVWDPRSGGAGRVYSHLVPDVTVNDVVTPPVAHAGRIYWMVSLHNDADPDLDFQTYTLYEASADLATVRSAGTASPVPFGTSGPRGSLSPMLSATAYEICSGRSVVRINYDGTGGIAQVFDSAANGDAYGVPGGGGTIALIQPVGSGGAVVRRSDSIGTSYAPLWPTSGAWLLDYAGMVSTSRDGSLALAFGQRHNDPAAPAELQWVGMLGRTVAPGGSPIKVFEVGGTPAGFIPSFFFVGY